MKTIVSVCPKLPGAAGRLLPLQQTKAPHSAVTFCRLNPWYRPFFPWILKRLCRSSSLYFCEEMRAYPRLYRPRQEPFYEILPAILETYTENRRIHAGIVCKAGDERLRRVALLLGEYAQTLTLCCEQAPEHDLEEALLLQTGTALCRQALASLSNADLVIVLSPWGNSFPTGRACINLSQEVFPVTGKLLTDCTSLATEQLFCKLRYPKIKQCYFISEKETIKKLIWENQKKS